MKFCKLVLFTLALCLTAGLFAAETISLNDKAQWNNNPKMTSVEGGINLAGNTFLVSKQFPVDPAKKYTITCTVSVANLPETEKLAMNLGFFLYDSTGRALFCDNVCVVPNTFTTTVADAKKGDTTLLVKNASKSFARPWHNLVIDAKEDLSDIPNRNIAGSNIKSAVQKENGWELTFASPLRKDIPAGTSVRLQSTGGYLGTGGNGIQITAEPKLVSGSIQGFADRGIWTRTKWPVGTATAAVFIQPSTKAKDIVIQFKDFAVIVE